MRRGCTLTRTEVRIEETGRDMVGEGTSVFSKKVGRKKRKEGAFRKKVHKFFIQTHLILKKLKHFSHKTFDKSKLNPYFCA